MLETGDAGDVEVVQPFPVFERGQLEAGRDFLFARDALMLLFQRSDRVLDQAGAPTLLTRRPVKTAQSIEDCASNLEFRVGLQLDALRGIVAIDGGDEA